MVLRREQDCMQRRYRIGFDIGGTFTDYILLDQQDGTVFLHKRLTTPRDPAEGALAGLQELLEPRGITLSEVDTVVHGTTLVTNTLIERSGVKTGLLTTKGFRDILEMGKEQRYDIFDLFLQYPEPLVPRYLRLELDERIGPDGEVLQQPDADQIRSLAAQMVAQGVEAVAVCLLHSYRNSAHERLVGEILAREFPDLHVSLSADVVPEIREFERSCTTVCNAYVQPLMSRYVHRLDVALTEQGFAGRFYLMQSNGGTASPVMARQFPIRLLESGPAGGALVAAYFGELQGRKELIAFDMGGTTAKASLIQDGKPLVAPMMEAARVHRFKRGSGLPIKAPVVDMIEIGTGGGSLARVDNLGLMKVGPQSAGADPGPACYGLGGTEPTVTDACLRLGYYDPAYFLGGDYQLDIEAAGAALARLGDRFGLSDIETAWGIYSIVCENMAAAARVYIIEKGQDPRRFAIVAFGGAGPAHATRVASILGVSEVVIPPASGAASALGFLVAPISFDYVQSLPGELREMSWAEVNEMYGEMETKGRALLEAAGVRPTEVWVERWAEMRLVGQFHDIDVPVRLGALNEAAVPELEEAFAAAYRKLYHTALPGNRVMALNWRLSVSGEQPAIRLRRLEAGADDPSVALKGHRQAYFPEAGGFVKVPVYDRHKLPVDVTIDGPAIVEEREATTVISPGDSFAVDTLSNLIIKVVPRS
jgi:5-oxoprolinase (ATP-hydrolysing)